ncbi:prostatic acid phosphatase-like [Candoia aspera]|uniref:prostatic acid phosphatase-like n=1 Tax=Candoia aspera TaxID=51853 RepID=UPI002FD877EF
MNLGLSFRSLDFSSLSLFFGLLLHCAVGRNLKFVVVIFRHGDRSPMTTFPTNTVSEDVWPQGYGQLTKIGMQQQYEFGQYLKARYKNFLSPSYKAKEIYVRSTDCDRTIMSAQVNLAGFFPPSASEAWNPHIHWQPIPVHTVPLSQEKLLIYPNFHCPRFNQLLQQVRRDTTVRKTLKQYMITKHCNFIFQPLLRRTSRLLGYNLRKLLDFQNLLFWNAYDTLKVQKIHNHSLPVWADTETMDYMKSFLEHLLIAAFEGKFRIEKSQLQGGNLVKHILGKIINCTTSHETKKMIMYSAHSMTIVALQTALGVYNQFLPPYAACHIFELYEENSGYYTIEMYYRNSTVDEPHPLILPGCSKACPLEQFKKLVAPILPQKEC